MRQRWTPEQEKWVAENWRTHSDEEIAENTGRSVKSVINYRQRHSFTRDGRISKFTDMYRALEKALANGITVHISREKYGNVVRGSKLDIEGNKRVSPVLVTKFVEALPAKINELTQALST